MGRFILPTLLLAAAITSFIVLTNPLYGDIKSLQEEQSAFGNALANSLQLQEVRDVLIEKQNQFSPRDLQKLGQMIPASVDNIKLAIEIQTIGENQGLSVESVQYDPKTEQEKPKGLSSSSSESNSLFEVFELEISAKGSYSKFLGFLREIEESLRIVDVVNVEFSSDSSFLNEDLYTYNIIIKTYRLKD
jgi:Tfp pilus assembly protein PilO